MEFTGKTNVFVKEVGEKKIKIFEASISRKDKEGNYVDNYTIRLNFSPEILPDTAKAKFKVGYRYQMEIAGFLSTRSFQNKEGKKIVEPLLFVTSAKSLDSGKEIKKAVKPQPVKREKAPEPEDDLPEVEGIETTENDLPF